MPLNEKVTFLKRYFREPKVVGAVAPSSRALSLALTGPFRRFGKPATILEVGAGTGPITRILGQNLGPNDVLDICEVQPRFADIIRNDVLSHPNFVPHVEDGRVQLYNMPVQDLPFEQRYDFVISGLPFTAFDCDLAQEIMNTIRRCMKPAAVLSYFEYVGLRHVSRTFALGQERERIRRVSSFMSDTIRNHQFARTTVLQNIPPAHARHLRFDKV